MDNVVPTFPLLCLPRKAMLNTLRIMTCLQIFGISVLSKKTKNLVESLKLTPIFIHVLVSETFKVHLHFSIQFSLHFQLYQVEENEPLQELGTPENFIICSEAPYVIWANSMSVKQLFDHLQSIFHSSIINTVHLSTNCERFSVESIHKNVKNVKHISLSTANHENNRRALSLFQPPSVSLASPALVNGCIPRYILIQNFNYIYAYNVQNTLDDLLMPNSCFINLFSSRSLTKTINKFLKLWVKGSNSRLERVRIRFTGNSQNDELLSGLKYQVASRNTDKLFKCSGDIETSRVIGGWDIWRLDGTKATITVRRTGGCVIFLMFVWHDHCIVN